MPDPPRRYFAGAAGGVAPEEPEPEAGAAGDEAVDPGAFGATTVGGGGGAPPALDGAAPGFTPPAAPGGMAKGGLPVFAPVAGSPAGRGPPALTLPAGEEGPPTPGPPAPGKRFVTRFTAVGKDPALEVPPGAVAPAEPFTPGNDPGALPKGWRCPGGKVTPGWPSV